MIPPVDTSSSAALLLVGVNALVKCDIAGDVTSDVTSDVTLRHCLVTPPLMLRNATRDYVNILKITLLLDIHLTFCSICGTPI